MNIGEILLLSVCQENLKKVSCVLLHRIEQTVAMFILMIKLFFFFLS